MPADASHPARRTGADRAGPHRRGGDGHHPAPRASPHRQHFSSNPDNLQLLDEEVARDEALLFKHAGGQTFVDPTNRGLARDPQALARVARATGLNIIMGSGYYVAAAHPPDMPNDGERMRQILVLIERGHLAQLLLSHDIAYKHCLTKWGGFGYPHLLVNVIPRRRAFVFA